MRRITAVILIFALGNFIFTYKSHYCFFPNGQRFHGDCEPDYHHQIKEYAVVGETPPPGYFPEPFHCNEFQKNNIVYKQTLLPVLSHIDFNFFPSFFCFNFRTISEEITFDTLPTFSCRGGPPLPPNVLRGPPLT